MIKPSSQIERKFNVRQEFQNFIVIVWIIFVFSIHCNGDVGVFALGVPGGNAQIDAKIVIAQRRSVDVSIGGNPKTRMAVGISQLHAEIEIVRRNPAQLQGDRMSERIEVIVGQVESIAFKRSDDIEQIAGDEQGYAVMEEGFPRSGQRLSSLLSDPMRNDVAIIPSEAPSMPRSL